MSSGEVRKVSPQEIQLVQNLIEQCLQLYMSQKEVVTALLVQENIEPGFTKLVWQKLEQENPEFFKAYHLRLLIKDQIREFNSLLARHIELKHQVGQAGGCFVPMPNGSHIPPMHQNSTCYAPENTGPALKTENMQQQQQQQQQQRITTTLPNGLTNCGSSMNSCMRTAVDASAHSRRIDVSPNSGMIQGINSGIIKTETGYTGDPRFIFGGDGNVRSAISDAAGSSFSSVEPSSTLLDADTSSFGYFGQISPNFGLSDLTADFSNSFDIVESYSGSPFLATGSDNFLDSHTRGDHPGEYKRLNGQSEGLNYEDFGSD